MGITKSETTTHKGVKSKLVEPTAMPCLEGPSPNKDGGMHRPFNTHQLNHKALKTGWDISPPNSEIQFEFTIYPQKR